MSHEYRVAIAIPLSGTDRVQSALKAKIGPLIDDLEQKIVALGMEATITDTTVRLKVKAETKAETNSGPLEPVQAPVGILTGQSPLVEKATGLGIQHPLGHLRAAEQSR